MSESRAEGSARSANVSCVPSPIRRKTGWSVASLLIMTGNLYSLCWLHGVISELRARNSTTLTPHRTVCLLMLPVFGVAWAAVIARRLELAIRTAYRDVALAPPRDMSGLWGIPLAAGLAVSSLFITPRVGFVLSVVNMAFALCSAQAWLNRLADHDECLKASWQHPIGGDGRNKLECPRCSCSPPLGSATAIAGVEHEAAMQPEEYAYRPVGDVSDGVCVTRQGISRLLMSTRPDRIHFEYRALGDDSWTSMNPQPADRPDLL